MLESYRGLTPALGILMLVFGVLVIALPQLLVWIVGLTLMVGGILLILGTAGTWGARRAGPARYGRY